MKSFSNFSSAFHNFVLDEARREAQTISEKDPPRSAFTLETLRQFTYKDQLIKLQESSPLLVACVTGSISKDKVDTAEEVHRKGLGGRNADQSIDLVGADRKSVYVPFIK